MALQTLHDAELALRPFVPIAAQLTGKDLSLERVEPLMSLLGNPEKRLKIIHIAGTSGKTSTSYYIAALLTASNLKVGLTVSPHVDKVSERVQVNGQPISDALFCSELEIFLELITQLTQPPSYFELLHAFALWVFDRQQVDYAVVETGLGGLHDSSNISHEPNKVCVITDIGYDHMHVLGDTLPEIALQKIGIMHAGNVGITYQQSDEIMQVFRSWTAEHTAQLQVIDEAEERVNYNDVFENLPLYQQRNWLIARHVYQHVAERDKLPVIAAAELRKTQRLQVPARMEIRKHDSKTLVMDGAHNEQKMTAFVGSFTERFPGVKPAVLVALKIGKEYEAVSPLLANLADQIIVTTFDTSQDLPAKSMDPELFAKALRVAGASDVRVVPDQRLAYDTLMQTPQAVRVITGSFYLISQLRSEQGI